MPKGKPPLFVCGVPENKCSGSSLHTNKSLAGAVHKAHGSSQQAFACMSRYLVQTQGYKKIGAKEFSPPDGGPVRVLTKKSRYGAKLRSGKEGSRHEPTFKRSGIVIG